MSKPIKGKTPSLIGGSNGRPQLVEAKKKSTCVRCKMDIPANTFCAGIPKLGGGFSSLRRFCKDCYLNVLTQTQKDLDGLQGLLGLAAELPKTSIQ